MFGWMMLGMGNGVPFFVGGRSSLEDVGQDLHICMSSCTSGEAHIAFGLRTSAIVCMWLYLIAFRLGFIYQIPWRKKGKKQEKQSIYLNKGARLIMPFSRHYLGSDAERNGFVKSISLHRSVLVENRR